MDATRAKALAQEFTQALSVVWTDIATFEWDLNAERHVAYLVQEHLRVFAPAGEAGVITQRATGPMILILTDSALWGVGFAKDGLSATSVDLGGPGDNRVLTDWTILRDDVRAVDRSVEYGGLARTGGSYGVIEVSRSWRLRLADGRTFELALVLNVSPFVETLIARLRGEPVADDAG